MNPQRPGDEEQVCVAGVAGCVLVPLDGAAFDAHAVGELFLGEAGGAPVVGDAAP